MQVNSESVNKSRCNAGGSVVDPKSARDFSNHHQQQFDLEFADVTLSNLRPPQASSTVERKVFRSTAGRSFAPENSPINDHSNCWSEGQSEDCLLTASAGESSLGLIDISTSMKDQSKMNNTTINIETERKLARQLLLKCSQRDNNPALYDTNKENNVNIQNLSATEEVKSSLFHQVSKLSSSSVSFEPTEFTGRSSIINEGGVTSSTSVLSSFKANNSNTYGFSFNSTAAELMEKFGNDDFLSGSQFDNRLLSDELSWRQNFDAIPPSATTVPVAPTNSVNKNNNYNHNNKQEHLNLTCFSGIIGDLDLSLASCATGASGGRKISVGEYFKRKCDPLGQLSNSTISSTVDRPNFGLHSIRSPERIVSHKSPVNGGELASAANDTVDVESESFGNNTMVNSCDETQLSKATVSDDLMSLSKIAQVLQSDELGGSPRRLIDQLLMLKKKQKSDNLSMLSSKTIMSGGGDTYTVLPARTSLPIMNNTASTTLVASTSDNDVGAKSNGLLFDNNSINGVIKKDFESFNDKSNFNNDTGAAKTLFPSTKDLVDAPESNKNSKAIKIIKTSILSPAESPLAKFKFLNHNSLQNNIKKNSSGDIDEDDGGNNRLLLENIRHRDDQQPQQQRSDEMIIKQELDRTNYEKRVNEKISIGKNTRDLYKCFIGEPRDADIEIKNESDRWLICTFKLDQIQGNKNNVEILVPSDQILIEPNESKTAKLIVNFLKVGDPIIASLNIQVMDMSTREIFTKQHMMCFIPTINGEFKNQDITCNSTSIPTTVGSPATANGDCRWEIELIDGLPVILKSNTNKYIRLKNTGNKSVNISVAVEMFEKLPEDNFNIEPKNLTLEADEMRSVLIKYHNTSRGIKLNDRQAVIKIKTDDNTYSYSAVLIKKDKKEEGKINEDEEERDRTREEKNKERESNKVGVDNENNDYCQRCNTPQRMMFTGASGTAGTRAGSVELGAGGDIVNDAGLSPSNNILSPASTASTGTTIVPRINLSGRNSPRSTISTATSNTGGSRPPTAVTDDLIIPIKSTNSTLVWTTVKVGKYENREFTIRNIGNYKIKLLGVITDKDNCYKFLKDRDSSTNITVTLQRMESKTFTVTFNPSSVGPAAGKITFSYFDKKQHHQNNDSNNKELSRPSRIIPLYGYGGYAKVCVGQALKIIGDQMWLPLGKLNSNGSLNTKIRLENTGDLSAYAKISLVPKAVYPSVESNWQIEPTELILAPKEVRWITLEFRPRREDMALLRGATASGVRSGCGNSNGNVTDIATLTIMHGDEPTRWRIRRLYKKIIQADEVKKCKDSKDIFMRMVNEISKVITGEKSINNLNIIRDSVQDLGILCRQLLRHAITLTMEWDSDDTMSIYPDPDDYYYDDDEDSNESKLFQSLYSASEINNCTAITVSNENTSYYLPSETRYLTDANYIIRANNNQPISSSSSFSASTSKRNPVTDGSIDVEADKNKQFTVSPLSVTLSPPILKHATVIITNMTSNNQPYRTKLLSYSELVSVAPSEGVIPARRGILVKIQADNNNSVDKNIEAVLRIYTANEKRDLKIKILTAASVPSTGVDAAVSAEGRTESGS